MSVYMWVASDRKRRVAMVLIVGLIAVTTIVFAYGHMRRLAGPIVVRRVNSSPPTVAMNHDPQRRSSLVETEIIKVTRNGFEPASITRPAGKFILMIENPAAENLQLQLSREAGESLHEIRSSREEADWNELQDLRPGRYVLTEQNHPEWNCLLTITAR